jgi:hypothetical protein
MITNPKLPKGLNHLVHLHDDVVDSITPKEKKIFKQAIPKVYKYKPLK